MRQPGSVFSDLGYLVGAGLRLSDDRYNVFTLTKGGQKYIGKEIAPTASDDVRTALQQRQVSQARFYRYVNTLPALTNCVRCPRVIRFNPELGYSVVEHFDRPFYPELGSELTNLQFADPKALMNDVEVFAGALSQLDYAFMLNRQTDEVCDPLTDEMKTWSFLHQGITAGEIDRALIVRASEVIDRHQRYVVACLQHRDMQPLHWFRLSPKPSLVTEIGLIDSERSDFDNPRFYDLADMYARLYTICSAQQSARVMLREFIRINCATPEAINNFRLAFLPVITLRAIAMTADAYCHNIKQVAFYEEAAKDLLERCLTERIERLLDE